MAEDVSSGSGGQIGFADDSSQEKPVLQECIFAGKKRGQWYVGWTESQVDKNQRVNVRVHPTAQPVKVLTRDVLRYKPQPFPDADVGDEISVRVDDPPTWYEARVIDRDPFIDVLEIEYLGTEYRPCTNSFVTANQLFDPIDFSCRSSQRDDRKLASERQTKNRAEKKGNFLMEDVKNIVLVTWKVEDDSKMEDDDARKRSFFAALRVSNAQFLAFQGLEEWLVDDLLSQKWFTSQYKYNSLYLAGQSSLQNRTVLFSKFPLLHVEQHRLAGGTVFTLCKTRVKGRPLHVVNVNFPESSKDVDKRVADSKFVCAVIQKIPSMQEDVVIAGNFGFPPGVYPEADLFRPELFMDSWTVCKKNDAFTRDPVRNKLSNAKSPCRLDYVLLRSAVWTPIDTSLLGDIQKPVPCSNFGMKVEMSFTQQSNNKTEDKTEMKHSYGSKSEGKVNELKILTYNVSTDFPKQETDVDRVNGPNGLIDVFKDAQADLICMQELKSSLLKSLLANPWFAENYPYSTADFHGDVQDRPFLPWFMCTFSKKPILATSVYYRKPHISTRCFLVATLEINQRRLDVCNIYLNASLSGGCERAMNLGFAFSIMGRDSGSDDAIIAGGFHFKDGFTPETDVVPREDWIDVWLEAVDENLGGATFKPSSNLSIHPCPEAHLNALRNMWGDSRLDRIYVRSQAWKVSKVDIVGSKSLEDENEERDHSNKKKGEKKLCPSKRYGIVTTLFCS